MFARRPVSRLIKPGDIKKEFKEKAIQFHGTLFNFKEKAIQFHGTFHGLNITNCTDFSLLRHTNADLKISLYVCVYIKRTPSKFRIPYPKNSRVIYA